MNIPFHYPVESLVRRHGPRGYSSYASYHPWLRDDFSFRCVYCLIREVWVSARGSLAIDHFIPVAIQPRAIAKYENLVYACVTCNLAKGKLKIPDPCIVLVHDCVRVLEDGSIVTTSAAARKLVRILGLDAPEYNEFRRLWIDIILLAMEKAPNLYRRLRGFPANLPDLQRLRPPRGNRRPEGIEKSFHAQRARGDLPGVF